MPMSLFHAGRNRIGHERQREHISLVLHLRWTVRSESLWRNHSGISILRTRFVGVQGRIFVSGLLRSRQFLPDRAAFSARILKHCRDDGNRARFRATILVPLMCLVCGCDAVNKIQQGDEIASEMGDQNPSVREISVPPAEGPDTEAPPRTPEQIVADFVALSSHQRTDDHLEQLALRPQLLTDVTQLDLENSPVTRGGLAHLSAFSNLSLLNLARTGTSNGLEEVARIPRLQTLILDGNPVDDAALASIAGAPELERLSLKNSTMSDSAFDQLAELENLKALHLDGNKDLLGRQFSEQVKQGNFRNLEELTAAQTQVGYYGLANIRQIPNLQVLELGDAQLTADSLNTISQCSKLRRLGISGAPIADNALQPLTKLRSLEELNLSGCSSITDAAFLILGRLQSLKVLNVNGTQMTEAGIEGFQRGPGEMVVVHFAKREFHREDE